MSRRFGAQHIANGYAAMGGNMARPVHKLANSGRSIAESIVAEAARARRMANATKSKK